MNISLSYSKVSKYEKCPRAFKYQYIDKLEEGRVKSTAMSRGTEIHNSVEAFLRGEIPEIHAEIREYYGEFFQQLKDAGAVPEDKIAIDRDWKVMDWDGDTYVRSVLDIRMPINDDGVVQVFELKTGKVYPDHFDQRELYAVKTKCLVPEAREVNVTGIYLDLKQNSSTYIHPFYYQEAKVDKWDSKFRRVLRDEDYIPTPSFRCRNCPFSKDAGGPCEF